MRDRYCGGKIRKSWYPLVPREARKIAKEKNLGVILTEAGCRCPLIGLGAARCLSDRATVYGKHDMQRVISWRLLIFGAGCIQIRSEYEMAVSLNDFAEDKKLTVWGTFLLTRYLFNQW
jgi:hypothetical protein